MGAPADPLPVISTGTPGRHIATPPSGTGPMVGCTCGPAVGLGCPGCSTGVAAPASGGVVAAGAGAVSAGGAGRIGTATGAGVRVGMTGGAITSPPTTDGSSVGVAVGSAV